MTDVPNAERAVEVVHTHDDSADELANGHKPPEGERDISRQNAVESDASDTGAGNGDSPASDADAADSDAGDSECTVLGPEPDANPRVPTAATGQHSFFSVSCTPPVLCVSDKTGGETPQTTREKCETDSSVSDAESEQSDMDANNRQGVPRGDSRDTAKVIYLCACDHEQSSENSSGSPEKTTLWDTAVDFGTVVPDTYPAALLEREQWVGRLDGEKMPFSPWADRDLADMVAAWLQAHREDQRGRAAVADGGSTATVSSAGDTDRDTPPDTPDLYDEDGHLVDGPGSTPQALDRLGVTA